MELQKMQTGAPTGAPILLNDTIKHELLLKILRQTKFHTAENLRITADRVLGTSKLSFTTVELVNASHLNILGEDIEDHLARFPEEKSLSRYDN